MLMAAAKNELLRRESNAGLGSVGFRHGFTSGQMIELSRNEITIGLWHQPGISTGFKALQAKSRGAKQPLSTSKHHPGQPKMPLLNHLPRSDSAFDPAFLRVRVGLRGRHLRSAASS